MQFDESYRSNYGCDVIKRIIIICLILLAGLASAYTPEQQTIIDGMHLSFQLGIAHEKAIQGQNVTEFNTLVDEYNAWIQQHFGEDTNLFMSKINGTIPLAGSSGINETTPLAVTPGLKNPFSPSSDLSKFGKQQVYNR
jgi:hypothetical protein